MDKVLTGKMPRESIGVLEAPRIAQALIAELRTLEDLSGVISDVCDDLGIRCAIPSTVLRPTDPSARIVGQALTVKNRPLAESVAEAVAKKISRLGEIEAHNLAREGDVLVVEGVEGVSSMGSISASIGKRQGQLGAVVDGAVRDIGHSRAIGYPIWSRGASPMTGKWRVETVAINVGVRIAGIDVAPGDLVVADEVGVCFVPASRVAEVLEKVKRVLAYETERMGHIDAGMSVPELARAQRKP